MCPYCSLFWIKKRLTVILYLCFCSQILTVSLDILLRKELHFTPIPLYPGKTASWLLICSICFGKFSKSFILQCSLALGGSNTSWEECYIRFKGKGQHLAVQYCTNLATYYLINFVHQALTLDKKMYSSIFCF